GALQRDVDVEILPGQLGRVLDRGHLDCPISATDGIALDLHLAGEATMDRVKAEQVCVGLDRSEIVDGDDLDIVALGLDNGAQDITADTAEPVDGTTNRHSLAPFVRR